MFDVSALRELMTWISRFRSLRPLRSFEETHRRLLGLIDELVTQCHAQAWPDKHIEWASYALCAAVDEAVMSRADAIADRWAGQPLQLIRFGEYTAGKGFFERLALIRSDPLANGRVLRIYWLVLTHGFLGKLALQSKEQRHELMEHIQAELTQHGWLDRIPDTPTAQPIQASGMGWRSWCLPVLWLAGLCCVAWMYRSADQHIGERYELFTQQVSPLINNQNNRDGQNPQ